ncbi:hypothetical protein KCP69_22050 [Salmonella enterica subsp. enterica]|nr:hypothetical protein KCP69_22050 [Salmonella enterica subsp. enterica]
MAALAGNWSDGGWRCGKWVPAVRRFDAAGRLDASVGNRQARIALLLDR